MTLCKNTKRIRRIHTDFTDFLVYIILSLVVFLLIYGQLIVASENIVTNNLKDITKEESLRTRPRQARGVLHVSSLAPDPYEEQRQNDKFLKNFSKVINIIECSRVTKL